MSLSAQTRGGAPSPVLSWSPARWRRLEAIRDQVMRDTGTSEPWYLEPLRGGMVAAQWRKPLTLAEVNQMAPTPEVKRREGRP